uniref:Adenylate kinase n=2 Tax=Macrostomum lignano TaxID=282301 RepID=A0A1I8HAZ4_9PLAT
QQQQQQLVVYAHASALDRLPWQLPGLLELRKRRDVRFLAFEQARAAAAAACAATASSSASSLASSLQPIFPVTGGPCLLLGDPLRYQPDTLTRLLAAAGRRDSRWPIGIRARDLRRLRDAATEAAGASAAASLKAKSERQRLAACLEMLEASRWAVDSLLPGEGGSGGAGLLGC